MNAPAAVIPAPFNTPPSPQALSPSGATQTLVQSQVDALLASTPSYHELKGGDRKNLRNGLVRIASYSAECARELCWQSEKLGQTPVVRTKEVLSGQMTAPPENKPLSRAQTSNFKPSAANQVARVTQETLKAIAFPTFVADLIRGTFNAIVQTSIQQMEAFVQMVSNVMKTVDQFESDNISDFQARDWLAQRYPEHIRIKQGMAVVRDGADDKPAPNFQRDLNLNESVGLDESSLEDTLVPAARRRLAESRLQVLSTLVLMGVNRIVITGGKIRATMGFHIDTSDRAHEEEASDFDFRTGVAGSFGFGPWSASASMSLSYVRSTRATSDAELNVDADLTGEVELHFKSDYFPVERFANQGALGKIQGNTAVPEANPVGAASSNPLGAGVPAAGGSVEAYKSSRSRRAEPAKPSYRPIGEPLPPAKAPDKPAPVEKVEVPANKTEEKPEPASSESPAAEKPEEHKPEPVKPTPEKQPHGKKPQEKKTAKGETPPKEHAPAAEEHG